MTEKTAEPRPCPRCPMGMMELQLVCEDCGMRGNAEDRRPIEDELRERIEKARGIAERYAKLPLSGFMAEEVLDALEGK